MNGEDGHKLGIGAEGLGNVGGLGIVRYDLCIHNISDKTEFPRKLNNVNT